MKLLLVKGSGPQDLQMYIATYQIALLYISKIFVMLLYKNQYENSQHNILIPQLFMHRFTYFPFNLFIKIMKFYKMD